MYGCQQHLVKSSPEVMAMIEYLCIEANKLTNCGIYYCRQMLFKAGRFLSKAELDFELKANPHFKSMGSACAQQTLHSVIESFNSYARLAKMFNSGELAEKPKPPKYRKKDGLAVVSYPGRWVKLVNGMLKFSLGKQVKAWFGIDHFLLQMPSNLDFKQIKEYRFVPRNNCFYLEFAYEQPQTDKGQPIAGNVLGIDPGLNNWLTCVSNVGKAFIVDGRKVKSQNQWYNKQIAKIKAGKGGDYWDDRLAAITEKRNRMMRDNINKAARLIINWCIEHQIGAIVFGWNQRQKDSINIGKKNNQQFVQIPTAKLKARIAELSELYGIKFVETEESYTSKASFLDDDFLPTFGEKPERWEPSGKRVNRGLYRLATGQVINADCNGAANILRKVSTQLEINLAKVCREVLMLPQRYRLDSLTKKYRKQCVAWQ
ncbi:transposase [Hydrocoleum sp. CS-953]|uniref:RNA-guided endonuclease InsQ/TnpB family protein n=1 Tax=Hydrocoleum sp. CS-953 TaxID=1671698 RepID=UPI000B9B4B57|nr:RNA-guided endonuclease TnpB family protein [Hydrocoleum sp. CS-953]OZH53437.1 transposase [Hydrocoleum sp. CS-953]